MMKIFKSLAIITAVVAIVGVGTYANYTATKEVKNVTLGAMPFQFVAEFSEDSDTPVAVENLHDMSLGDVAPGDGDDALLAVKNTSKYDGNFSLKIAVAESKENSFDDREIPAGDDASSDAGELCKSIMVRVLDENSAALTGWYSFETFGTRQLGIVSDETTRNYKVEYSVPTTVGNEILTDTCKFNADLVLTQIAGFNGSDKL